MEGAEWPFATGKNASSPHAHHPPGVRLLLKTILSQGESEMRMPLGTKHLLPLYQQRHWLSVGPRRGSFGQPLWPEGGLRRGRLSSMSEGEEGEEEGGDVCYPLSFAHGQLAP